MNVKTLGAGLILAGTLVMSGNAGGAHATGTLRPEAVQTSYGSLNLLLDILSGSNSSDATFGPVLEAEVTPVVRAVLRASTRARFRPRGVGHIRRCWRTCC